MRIRMRTTWGASCLPENLIRSLLSLVAVGAMALPVPALGQTDSETEYKFKVTNFTELEVSATCETGDAETETVGVDEASSVITCPSDGLRIVQSETNIAITFRRGTGDDCQPEDILHAVLGGTTTWQGGNVLTQFPYASIHANLGCEVDA